MKTVATLATALMNALTEKDGQTDRDELAQTGLSDLTAFAHKIFSSPTAVLLAPPFKRNQ
jgi:hypothetical protein